MKNKKVAIIGLGLIGGSLARALSEKAGILDITAVNRSIEPLNTAIKDGSITRGFHEINDYIFDADIIFICTPVKRSIELISILSGKIKQNTILTDVVSTKSEIIDYVNSLQNPPCFIGGHPMAGTEKSGYGAGFSHLFENAFYILTPSKGSNEAAIATLTSLIAQIGGIPITLSAQEHDMITGIISHVPHIVASALVNLVKSSDNENSKIQLLAAGGFKDITRIASSSPEMWENIVLSNGKQIRGILQMYVELLVEFITYIEKQDSKKIFEFFSCAKTYRDQFSTSRKGLIAPNYELVLDVMDKPGIIGEIATLLGNNLINIKNISISNNREFEQGCLRINLPDAMSQEKAYNLLLKSSYLTFKVV